jgi:hypothetical protein
MERRVKGKTSTVEMLHTLTECVVEAAGSAENEQRRRLWLDSNGLGTPERPPVFIDLFDTWHEVLPLSSLECTDTLERDIELKLKKALYKFALGDDDVVEPWVDIDAVTNLGRNRGVGLWGVEIRKVESSEGAWLYADHPIQCIEDIGKLSAPRLVYDWEATESLRIRAMEILGGRLPVRVSLGNTYRQWAKLHSWASAFCGHENLYVNMIDKPEFIHALMRFMSDGIMQLMNEVEKAGILHLNNVGRLSCADLPAPGYNEHHVRFEDIWGRGESQEIDGVSPSMFEEFLFQYQLPILSRFGIINYGCCENLTNKIEIVMRLPNLRQFICSAWTSPEEVVSRVGRKCAIEWRQKASEVIDAADRNQLKKQLRSGLEVLRGCHVQIMLDSVMTTNGNPGRLKEWVEVAKDIGSEIF